MTTTILQVIPELNTGGAELSTVEITGAVVQAGGRALVATEGGRMAEDVKKAGGEIITLPLATKNPFKIYKNAGVLASIIKDENVSLIHARSRAPAWSALFAARRTHCPFVTTYHGAYGNKEPFKDHYNRVMAKGDIVIANSEYTADLVRRQHSPEEQKLRVVHRGVDTQAFDKSAISTDRKNALRAQWGVEPDEKVILQAARLTGWKGQEVVIDAIARLSEQRDLSGYVFVLAGDEQKKAGYKAQLVEQIANAGLEKQIRLPGHCSDMAAAFSLAHVSIVASIEPEAFGRAAVEAQALECPVIVTDIGAATETVLSSRDVAADRITGWRIPPGDPEILAQTLHSVMDLDSDQRQALGKRAWEHVTTNFSLTQMRGKTLAIYDELIGSKLSHSLEK